MAGRTAIWFITLFLAYNAMLLQFPLNNVKYFSLQDRVEEFVFNNHYYDTILVGSSLVGKIGKTPFFQGNNFLNLFLNSNGSLTGIELVIRSGKIPKVLILETNHLIFGINTDLIKSVFNYHEIKKILPSLRSKNKLIPYLFKKIKPDKKEYASKNFSEDYFRYMMYKKIKEHQSIDDSMFYKGQLVILNSQLEYLERHGCQIFLVETPMERELLFSKRAVYFRKMLRRMLADRHYIKVPMDRSRYYRTTDGIHLLEEESVVFENYLKRFFLWTQDSKIKTENNARH